jgi:hypothetical protein
MLGLQVVHEEARMLSTASKRKTQRVEGALNAIGSLAINRQRYSAAMLEAEDAVSQSHAELAALMEQTDAGDTLKRARNDWYEASAMTDYVKLHADLAIYLSAVEQEETDALRTWEGMQSWRELLREAKRKLAHCQGHLYAMLELGFKPPIALEGVVEQQRAMWRDELQRTQALMLTQKALVEERRGLNQQFHREQGWRKAVERFGNAVGLGADALLAVRLQVLEADEICMRTTCKARLKVLKPSMQQHESVAGDLLANTGALNYLAQVKEQPTLSDESLAQEEYEASLEMQMLEGTLEALAPRVEEALRVRSSWQSAMGAQKIAEALAAPELPQLTAEAHEAAQEVEAGEPVRSEKRALDNSRGKLRGKLQVVQALRNLLGRGVKLSAMAAEIERLMSDTRLAHLRLSMKVGGRVPPKCGPPKWTPKRQTTGPGPKPLSSGTP